MASKKDTEGINHWAEDNSDSTVMDIGLDISAIEDGLNDRKLESVTSGAGG